MSSPAPGGGPGPSMADLDHGDLGPNMLAASFTTWGIALIFVILRFWTRATIVRKLGFSDYFIALSLIAAGGMCVSILIEIRHGMGKHVWDVDFPSDFVPMMEAWWFSLLCYVLSLALTKVSICLLYLTIFTFDWARRACYAVLFVVVVTNLWGTAITLTYCIPLQAAWDPAVVASFCQPQSAWWANTSLVIITDFMIFLLPIPFVLPLKLPRRQKIVVVGIFAVGFFVCIVSFVRLSILIAVKGSTDPDFTYSPTDLTYWTAIEVHTAIVVACTMTLKPLVTRFFPNLLNPRRSGADSSSKSDTSGGGGGGGGAGAMSDGPPLTIGSKPTRQPLPGARAVEEVMMGDFERQVRMEPEEKLKGGSGEEVKGGRVEMVDTKHERGPWVRSDAASERTEDLGREMTARSIG